MHEIIMTDADQDKADQLKNAILDLCLQRKVSTLVALSATRCAAEGLEELINEQGGEVFTVAPAERTPVEGEHAEHYKHVSTFLSEMAEIYSLDIKLGDEMKVADVCAALLKVSREIRERMQTTPSDSARLAAKEIADWMNWKKNIPQIAHEQNIVSLTNMLSKYFAAAPADNDALEVCRLLTTLDWIVGYELAGENQTILDRAQELALKVMGMSDPPHTTKGGR